MKKRIHIHSVLTVFFTCLAFAGFCLHLPGNETLVRVSGDSNLRYNKPEVAYSPSGDVFIAYQVQSPTGQSEILLSKYSSTGSLSEIGNISNSSSHSYEPSIAVQNDGSLHLVWADKSGNAHEIKYRSLKSGQWSGIVTMGTIENWDLIEDMNIVVDNAGNSFVVFSVFRNNWSEVKCGFITKYGDDINMGELPLSGRLKHPDVAVDSNNIHIVVQHAPPGYTYYTITYISCPNHRYSKWGKSYDLGFKGTQRPRISVDRNNTPHVVFFEKFPDSTRHLWHRAWNGSSFSNIRRMSHESRSELYHFPDISAVNADNLIATIQRGGHTGGNAVNYRWKRNGKWSSFLTLNGSIGHSPTYQSVVLAPDRFLAAIAFADRDNAVYLVLLEEQGTPDENAPTASFTVSPQSGSAPLDVTCDATSSYAKDGQIVRYDWIFGDGKTGTGDVVVHRFENKGEFQVVLTVTDSNGRTGSTSQMVEVDEINLPPVAQFTFDPIAGLQPLTVSFDASSSYDPDGKIINYEWDFNGEHTANGKKVTYTFSRKGVFSVLLIIHDNNMDSASASGSVDVWGLHPPLNINATPQTNRNLFTVKYLYHVTWNANPANDTLDTIITQYNIYRKKPGAWSFELIGSVNASEAYEFNDHVDSFNEDYAYTVTTVDYQGRESDRPFTNSVVSFQAKIKE